MSDEFQKKLAEIASRAEAIKQKTSNAAAELEAARSAEVVAVNATIAEWKARIAPLVREKVRAANPIIAATEIHLDIGEDHARVLEVGDNMGHPMPPLPYIAITATHARGSSRKPAVHQRLAGALTSGRRMAAAVPASIQIGVQLDGRIKINAIHCRFNARSPFLPEQFDAGQIESAIGDFVDALISPPAQS